MRTGRLGEVPAHLRDSHYRGAASLGHGEGYVYPHDDPRGWVPQRYRPPDLDDRSYYEPSGHGDEAEVAQPAGPAIGRASRTGGRRSATVPARTRDERYGRDVTACELAIVLETTVPRREGGPDMAVLR